jgi:sugar lactone lactonase YvrE
VVADSAGNVFVADTLNHTIRKVTPVGLDWVVTTVAGKAGTVGNADGTNATPRFNRPAGIALDRVGNLFVADQANHAIRELSPVGTNWVVTTLAGKAGYAGSTDGDGSVARFSNPAAVAVDSAGNVFVADGGNKTIRKATPVGTNWLVTTIGGTAGVAGSADGIGSSASFGQPAGIAVDRAGNLYVADFSTHRLAKGTPSMLRPTITVGFDQAQLSLSWPLEYVGWHLQAQTNTLGAGLGTNWFVVPGSATTNQWTIPFDLASPGVFFELRQGP